MKQLSASKKLSLLFIVLGVALGGITVLRSLESPFEQQASLPQLLAVADLPELHPEVSSEQAASFAATLSAEAVYVMDINSASTLLSKNPTQHFYPASTTKMMTALVARQQYPLESWAEMTPQATSQGTVVGFMPGDRFTIADALKGLLIFSGNDAAELLAHHDNRGRAGFIMAMNTLASQLHLSDTHFSNPSGLDDAAQQTTARDLTILAKEIVSDDFLSSVVSTSSAVLVSEAGRRIPIYSTNYLLRFPEYAGVKTGTTELAGEVLITKVLIHQQPVLVTLLKSEDRYQDMEAIVTWIKNNYDWKTFAELRAE